MLAVLTALLVALSHDFHFSRTDLVYSNEGTWYVTIRVFSDDLESQIQKHRKTMGQDDGTPVWLGDELEHHDAAEWVGEVATTAWSLDINGSPIPCAFLGYEVDYDVTYLYLESMPAELPNVLTVSNSLFFDLFDDQVNEVHVSVNATDRRELLTREMPSWTYTP